MYHRAFSLVEVSIAMAIFAVLMLVAFEALDGMRRFTEEESEREDLTLEGDRLTSELVALLGNSAWFVTPNTNVDLLATDLAFDRQQARYYPYILQQNEVNGSPYLINNSPFAGFRRAANQAPSAATINADRWNALPEAHRQASQEVVFLRVATGPLVDSPLDLDVDAVRFATNAVPMTAYDDPTRAVRSRSMMLRTSNGVMDDVPLNWETWPAADPWWELTTPATSTPIPDPDRLREYTLAVVPVKGNPQLQLRYRNGKTGAINVLRVLSTMVDRVVIDTYRTAGQLNVNQVRIVLYLSKLSRSGQVQTRRVEVIAALRSTVDPEYSLRLGDWLGGQGGKFDF